MNCDEIFEALSEFIDADLPKEVCKEIEMHLADCHNCRIVVSTLRKTVTLYHSMPLEEMPDEVRMRLHRIIRLNGEEG